MEPAKDPREKNNEFIAYSKSNPGKVNMGLGDPWCGDAYVRRAFQNNGWY